MFKLKMSGTKGFIISFAAMAVVVLFVMWLNFERLSCIRKMKIEFQRFQESVVEAGYDISYSDLKFSKSSLFGVMTLKDLRLNNLNANDYIEYYAEEVKINPGFFSVNKIKLDFSGEQKLTIGEEEHTVYLPQLSIMFGFDQAIGLKSINLIGKDLEIENIIKIGEVKLASQRMSPQQISYVSPFLENHLELKNIEITNNDDWPVAKKIERIYLHANIVGALIAHNSYKDSIMSWLGTGGMIDIKKLIINWDYFIMVAKGDIYFNENLDPNLHLNTSSKGLMDFLDNLQNFELLDSKGIFVAKILLNNKAFKLKEDDKYSTLTTPINVNKKEFSVENIAIKFF